VARLLLFLENLTLLIPPEFKEVCLALKFGELKFGEMKQKRHFQSTVYMLMSVNA